MVAQEIREVINTISAKYSLDPDLVEAVVMQESSGRPKATRYEEGFYNRYVAPHIAKNGWTMLESKGRATSWGLMQVMGQVLREAGFKDRFEKMYDPATALEYGCRHLAHQFTRYAGVADKAIAAYNAGTAVVRKETGKFVNQQYVDGVNKYLSQIKGS